MICFLISPMHLFIYMFRVSLCMCVCLTSFFRIQENFIPLSSFLHRVQSKLKRFFFLYIFLRGIHMCIHIHNAKQIHQPIWYNFFLLILCIEIEGKKVYSRQILTTRVHFPQNIDAVCVYSCPNLLVLFCIVECF